MQSPKTSQTFSERARSRYKKQLQTEKLPLALKQLLFGSSEKYRKFELLMSVWVESVNKNFIIC